MRFKEHFHETPLPALKKIENRYDSEAHETAVWNAFVDSDLTGINDDDCALFPRVLPASYLPSIRRTAHDITLFALRLLSLPQNEIKAIIPHGPIRDFLIEELEVLRFHPRRLTGSFRFDMAIVGEPERGNPPKLLEINEMGFDGLARSSFIQQTYFDLMPELKKHAFALDTAKAEIENMMRLGHTLARFQYDCYNWDEEVLLRRGTKLGADIKLVSPAQYGYKIDSDYPLLLQKPVSVKRGRIQIGDDIKPDAVQMSIAFKLADYKKAPSLYRDLVRAKTPQYAPFITGLVASKMILVLLSDAHLRKKLLGSAKKIELAILPATPLDGYVDEARANWNERVLKHVDGLGGEQVYMGDDLLKRLQRIRRHERAHYIVQERTRLNVLTVRGILSKPRQVISDLGVFVQYDWAKGEFKNFGVGGIITRATNRSFKVNVSGGGIQVPVMFARGK